MKAEKLQKILRDHALYQDSGGKEGAIAFLLQADLRGADLSGLDLREANLRSADLSLANLANARLSGANLIGANLRDASLRNANLRDVSLSAADLRSADLCGANLCDANLRDADLSDADLSNANLVDANLCGADLSGANLRHASLRDADLSDARIDLSVEDGLLRKIALKVLGERESFDNEIWHNYCNTVHCIAGYAVFVSKDREVEGKYGTEVAGLMLLGIEAHSHFFDTNKAALRWLEEVAERPITSD